MESKDIFVTLLCCIEYTRHGHLLKINQHVTCLFKRPSLNAWKDTGLNLQHTGFPVSRLIHWYISYYNSVIVLPFIKAIKMCIKLFFVTYTGICPMYFNSKQDCAHQLAFHSVGHIIERESVQHKFCCMAVVRSPRGQSCRIFAF